MLSDLGIFSESKFRRCNYCEHTAYEKQFLRRQIFFRGILCGMAGVRRRASADWLEDQYDIIIVAGRHRKVVVVRGWWWSLLKQ